MVALRRLKSKVDGQPYLSSGEVGAVTADDRAVFSGFAALTRVDTDTDGQFDALFGNVNFIDDNNEPATPVQRLGRIAHYDLSNGSWD